MSEALPVNGFDWMEDLSKIDEDFIKNYDEDSNKGHILEVDVKYPKKLHDLHSGLPFLPQRMKNDKRTDMNTELRKQAENDCGKDFFKLMNNRVFGKTMENVRKRRDIKLVTTDKRRTQLGQKLIIIQQNGFQKTY